MPTPSAAAKDTITDDDQQQRRDDRAQQHDQDREHDEQRQRDDQLVVARRGLAQVVLLRGRAADERAGRRPPTASRSSGIVSSVADEYGVALEA